jgi:hypothetical protein
MRDTCLCDDRYTDGSAGEATWGAAKDSDSFIWITLGTGLGTSFLLNKKLYLANAAWQAAWGIVSSIRKTVWIAVAAIVAASRLSLPAGR